jgi:hypothetical protein
MTNRKELEMAIAIYHNLGVFASVIVLIFSVTEAKLGFPVIRGGSWISEFFNASNDLTAVLTMTF